MSSATTSIGAGRALARRVPGAAPAAQAWAAGVVAAHQAWVDNFAGEQFTLGRAWYTHLEQSKTREYFAGASASDASVETHCPGLQQAMLAFVEQVTGERAWRRPGFCGPGVHIFPVGHAVSRRGGDLHFDTEGLTPEHLQGRTPAITAILMLSPPDHGGGLRVWDAMYEGVDRPPRDVFRRHSEVIGYETGDLVVIDSYRLHRIEPFTGSRDRITATCHAVRSGGGWEIWF